MLREFDKCAQSINEDLREGTGSLINSVYCVVPPTSAEEKNINQKKLTKEKTKENYSPYGGSTPSSSTSFPLSVSSSSSHNLLRPTISPTLVDLRNDRIASVASTLQSCLAAGPLGCFHP